jgi:hypothetical protein
MNKVISYLETGKTQLKMTTKEFINAVNDEFDIETLELMQNLIKKRLLMLKTMMDVATKKQIKGFRR